MLTTASFTCPVCWLPAHQCPSCSEGLDPHSTAWLAWCQQSGHARRRVPARDLHLSCSLFHREKAAPRCKQRPPGPFKEKHQTALKGTLNEEGPRIPSWGSPDSYRKEAPSSLYRQELSSPHRQEPLISRHSRTPFPYRERTQSSLREALRSLWRGPQSPNVEDPNHHAKTSWSTHTALPSLWRKRTQIQRLFICTQRWAPQIPTEKGTPSPHRGDPPTQHRYESPTPQEEGNPSPENTSHPPKPTEEPLAPIQKRGLHLHPGKAVLKATWFCLRHVSRPPLSPLTAACPSGP